MEIVIGIAEADCRAWLVDFVRDLEAAGYGPRFDIRKTSTRANGLVPLALAIEKRLYGRPENPWAPLSPERLPPGGTAEMSSWALDLSGLAGGGAALNLSLGGSGGISTLPAYLFAGNQPLVSIRRANRSVAAEGLPSVEGPEIALNSFREVTRRLSTLVLMALDGKERPSPEPYAALRTENFLAPLVFTGRGVFRKLVQKISPARFRADHWRTGIRRARDLDVTLAQTPGGFRWLQEDGTRFYADPVLWTEDGRDFLFVEEFPYATGKGILSYTELDAGGAPLFQPRPIIERATHLSYPYLLRHDGAIYMMPENAAEEHVPLYRARRFPDQWEELPPLIAGHGLHDATLFEHDGRWWILANAAPHGAASWDCLVAFHATSPLGPYSPHALNPILVDARHARCGGPPLRIDGRLIRPVQNCLGGYGRKLHFFEIEELTPERFRQKRLGEFAPPAGCAMAGVHTYGHSPRFEVIDALFPAGMGSSREQTSPAR